MGCRYSVLNRSSCPGQNIIISGAKYDEWMNHCHGTPWLVITCWKCNYIQIKVFSAHKIKPLSIHTNSNRVSDKFLFFTILLFPPQKNLSWYWTSTILTKHGHSANSTNLRRTRSTFTTNFSFSFFSKFLTTSTLPATFWGIRAHSKLFSISHDIPKTLTLPVCKSAFKFYLFIHMGSEWICITCYPPSILRIIHKYLRW